MTALLPPPLPSNSSRSTIGRWVGWLLLFIIVLLPSLFIQVVIKPFRVPTHAMAPTLLSHDRIYAERLSYLWREPKRGEIVVFKTDTIPSISISKAQRYVKRIVGVPGDRIAIDLPYLVVNGQRVVDPPIFARISSCQDGYAGFRLALSTYPGAVLTTPQKELVLREKEFFVLGDNSTNSFDSRYWGPVPRQNIGASGFVRGFCTGSGVI
jgi:signal peptidase I